MLVAHPAGTAAAGVAAVAKVAVAVKAASSMSFSFSMLTIANVFAGAVVSDASFCVLRMSSMPSAHGSYQSLLSWPSC
jgi:hypothetical protein